MSKRLTIHNKDYNPIYDIMIEQNFDSLGTAVSELSKEKRNICIVTDSNVGPLYASQVKDLLRNQAKKVIVFQFDAGEANKNLDVVRQLYAVLIEAQFDRHDLLAALGGGVVGDLTGFAAATYLRGIDFIQIPTTLLAQADSSVGGKTGVDFDGYKNMVGAFCMPKLVYMNVSTFQTLDCKTYLSGMGEVLKHGYIRDAAFLNWVLNSSSKILQQDPDTLESLSFGNADIKRKVVEEDPTEQGIRALLNFGHTLGHAIEKQKSSQYYHGECVALGMVAAAWISCQKGMLSADDLQNMERILTGFELPVRIHDLNLEEALQATLNDKKMKSGHIRFILLQGIGNAIIDTSVTMEEMKKGLEYLQSKDPSTNQGKVSGNVQ